MVPITMHVSVIKRWPLSLTEPAASFLAGLLRASESERLGAGPGGFMRILAHPWLADIDWESMLRREAPAPFVPSADGHIRAVNFSGKEVMHPPTPFEEVAEHATWEARFAEYGRLRSAPWALPGTEPARVEVA